MEAKLNTIIKHNDKKYRVTQSGRYPVINGCDLCGLYVDKDEPCNWQLKFGNCMKSNRTDGINVHFVDIDKKENEECQLIFSEND